MNLSRHDNPFAPPVTDEPAAPPEVATGSFSVVPRVFGVLSIIFASVMLLVFLIGALGAAAMSRRPANLRAKAGAEQVPTSSRHSAKLPVEVDSDKSPPGPSPAQPSPSAVPPRRETRSAAFGVLAGVGGLLFLLLTPALLVIGIGQVRYRRWAVKPTIVWAVLALASLACLVGMGVLERDPSGRPMLTMIPSVVFLAPYPILLLVFFTRQRTIASMRRTS